MQRRMRAVGVTVVALVALAPVPAVAQASEDGWTVSRTPDGQPGLGGVWANNSATPMQRPAAFEGKESLTDEELAVYQARAAELHANEQAGNLLGPLLFQQVLEDPNFREFDAGTGNYNSFWLVERELDNRTSLIVDPPNGRIPPLTPEAQRVVDARREYLSEHPADSWSDRNTSDRCIVGFNAGPPITPLGYNQNLQVFQTPDHVVLVTEMVHTVRVVPLDGRPALSDGVRQWSGDSRGHWEGDTLVVETSNFNDQRRWRGSTPNMKLVERFTRIDADTLAKQCHMSRQTLYRRLKKEGLGFHELVEEVRKDKAMRYVASDHYALGEIAFLLGFSELSAFSRAFKRWTGMAPAQYRARHLNIDNGDAPE